ncbi:MAG: hypothetical protein Q4F28_01755 [Eubacteriales bacterium]|nr:hypothetical protein [Eubacteriales bacterium]
MKKRSIQTCCLIAMLSLGMCGCISKPKSDPVTDLVAERADEVIAEISGQGNSETQAEKEAETEKETETAGEVGEAESEEAQTTLALEVEAVDYTGDAILGTWAVRTDLWTEETNQKYNVQWSPYLIFRQDGQMAYTFGDQVIQGTYQLTGEESPYATAQMEDGRVLEINIYQMVMDVTNMPPVTEIWADGEIHETTSWGFTLWSDAVTWDSGTE